MCPKCKRKLLLEVNDPYRMIYTVSCKCGWFTLPTPLEILKIKYSV